MRNVATAIDFGTSKIVTLVAASNKYHRFDIIGAGTVPYDGYRDGAWNVLDQIDKKIEMSISEAASQSNRDIHQIYVGVPGEFSRVYLAEASVQLQGVEPQVTPSDLERIFQAAREEIMPVRGAIIHFSPSWFMVDDGKRVLEPVGTKGSVLKSLISFVVADEFFLNEMHKRMQALHIEIQGFYSSPMGESTLFLPQEDRDRTAALIDVGYLNTEIMVMEGDALLFHKVLPVGGAHITMDLTYALKTRMSVAEEIKRSFVFGMPGSSDITYVNAMGQTVTLPHEEVAGYIQPRVDEIAELIGQALDHSGVRLGSWSNIYLTGGGLAMMRGGREYLSAQMERPIRATQPKAATLTSPIYASSLGLIDLVMDTVEKSGAHNGWKDKILNVFKRS